MLRALVLSGCLLVLALPACGGVEEVADGADELDRALGASTVAIPTRRGGGRRGSGRRPRGRPGLKLAEPDDSAIRDAVVGRLCANLGVRQTSLCSSWDVDRAAAAGEPDTTGPRP